MFHTRSKSRASIFPIWACNSRAYIRLSCSSTPPASRSFLLFFQISRNFTQKAKIKLLLDGSQLSPVHPERILVVHLICSSISGNVVSCRLERVGLSSVHPECRLRRAYCSHVCLNECHYAEPRLQRLRCQRGVWTCETQ